MKPKANGRFHSGTGSFAFPGRDFSGNSLAFGSVGIHGTRGEQIFVGRAFARRWLPDYVVRTEK
jgi:hypothetical protein